MQFKFKTLLLAMALPCVFVTLAKAGAPDVRAIAYASDSSDATSIADDDAEQDAEGVDQEDDTEVQIPESAGLNELPTPDALPMSNDGTTLEELLQLALSDHPGLAAARSRICEEKGTWLQVGLKPNPQIGYAAQEVGNSDSWGQHSVYVQKKLIQGNKLELNRSVASHDVDRARREYSATEQRILNDIKAAFYSALIAQIRRDVSSKLTALSDESVRTAELLLKAEELTRISLLQSKTEQHAAQLSAMASATREVGSKRELAATVGHPELNIGILDGDALQSLPYHDWNAARERLYDCPQLAIQLTRIERARCALARARAENVPDVSVQAGVLYDDDTDHTAANFSVSRPILLHDCNQGNIRRAAAELATAEHELERTMLRLEKQLAVVFRSYQISRQQVDSYATEILPSSRETLELVTKGFKVGEVDYLTLLMSQRTYIETYLKFLDALQGAWQASVRIQGCLLSGSLPPSN